MFTHSPVLPLLCTCEGFMIPTQHRIIPIILVSFIIRLLRWRGDSNPCGFTPPDYKSGLINHYRTPPPILFEFQDNPLFLMVCLRIFELNRLPVIETVHLIIRRKTRQIVDKVFNSDRFHTIIN